MGNVIQSIASLLASKQKLATEQQMRLMSLLPIFEKKQFYNCTWTPLCCVFYGAGLKPNRPEPRYPHFI